MRQPLNFRLSTAVYVVVQFAAQAVFCVLTILAHHDDRRLNGREHGEKQVEQNKWVGIPGLASKDDIDRRIDNEDNQEGNDEGP